MKDSFKFDFDTGEFVLDSAGDVVTVSGIEALKQWVQKILRTQYNRYKLYNGTYYGSNIEDLVVGKSYNMDFTESELKREIEKALLKNDDIYTVASTITRKKEKLYIDLVLTTVYGAAEEAVSL
ncbi:MAG: DUF2634 domain-containing protein [Clostridia bacterium]|nr:DUF2634 domain-containing protein [Clostridia bacterium]